VTPGHRRIPPLLARLGLLAISSLLALGLAEAVVRITGRAPAIKVMGFEQQDTVYRRSTNPLLGFEMKPNYRNDDADYSMSFPFTNSYGQRDVEREIEKTPGVRRILLLGDSVVEGHGIRDLDQTLSRQLEKLFGDDGTTEVLNFGVSGYCTLAEVELLEVKGLAFEPDIVILVFVFNDFDNFNREVYRLATESHRPALIDRTFTHSHLFRLAAVRFDLFGFGADADPIRWNRDAIGDNNVVVALERLKRLASAYGFQPLVAIWPMFDGERVFDVHALPDGEGELLVERLAWENGIATIRLSSTFLDDANREGERLDPLRAYTVGDGIHPSPRGCNLAAHGLREAVDRLESGALVASTVARGKDPGGSKTSSVADTARALGSEIPTYAEVHNNTGVSLQMDGDLEGAADEFRQALEIAPEFATARMNLGNVMLQRGKFDEALENYRRALEQRPDAAELRYNIGLAHEARGDLEAAADAYGQTLELDPDSALAQAALARVNRLRAEEASPRRDAE